MKKLLLLLALVSFNAFAYPFVSRVDIFVNQYNAIARVQNISYYPIVCNGQAFGVGRSGLYFYSYVNNLVIYPGSYVDVYVSSNNIYDPLVDARAAIGCVVY